MKDISTLKLKLQKIEKNVVKELIKAQRTTAYDVGLDVRKLAPKDTGRYADSIKVSNTEVDGMTIKTKIYTDAVVVSSKKKRYNLGYLLETGTSPHIIEPVYAPMLHFLVDGKDVYAKLVHHPGFVAMPHFEPALNANKYRYKQNIKEAIRRSFK